MTTHPTIVIAPNTSLAGALLPIRQVVQALHAVGTDPTQESVQALTTILLSMLDTLETNLATPQEVHPNG